jgi:hypothetical protein
MNMTRARRLVSVAVAASLAVTGLSACRSEPSVAAYVGDDKRITESQVEKLWDEVQDAAPTGAAPAGAAEAAGQPAPVSVTRADIVRTLVSVDVLTEVAKAQSVGLPSDLSLPDYANQLKLPETVEYVRLYATSDTLVRLLRAKAQNGPAPSDDDLKEVYDVLVANQGIDPGTSFDTFKTSLPAENKQLVQSSAAVRDQIEETTGKLDITVNPRYQPLSISVLEFQTQNGALRPLVVAPLGDADETSPVIDAR